MATVPPAGAVSSIAEVPVGTPTTAAGFYGAAANAITAALDSGSHHVAYHGAFHRLQRLFLSDARLKAMLRKIGKLVDIVQPAECANYFRPCGYDPS